MLPIYGRFLGDFTAHLVAVDNEDTIGEVAAKIAVHSIRRRLPAEPAGSYEVSIDGRVIPAEVRVSHLSLRPLHWIDVRWKR
ncbi:MAG: Toluene-4-monooxygenase system [Gammaproteobacteria bacterium]|nr:Toluene-4-monooxygenase system [Gammaproteobacteria bacterium]